MKGHISKYYTIWCGRCDKFMMVDQKRMQLVLKEVKEAGWKNHKDDGWLCPECSKK